MIEAITYLKSYIKRSSPYLESFFAAQLSRARAVSPIATKMVDIYRRFIGGKRLRGALTYASYQMFGGKSEEDIIKASTIIEVIHAFGLMHDDIIDEDALRRGQPTVHTQYENIFNRKYFGNTNKTASHFGSSMALDVGDLGSFFGNLILYETNFPDHIKLEFLKTLSETIITTVYGQGLDIHFELDPNPTEEKVLKVHRYKTANYTINGPLRYGATLAGLSPTSKEFKALELFGTPVGVAFQIRDDELGMFSTEEKLGKPVDSDLREGKNTLLFSTAFEKGSKKQLDLLRSIHGNKNLKTADVETTKKIIVETGSLTFSQKEGRRLVKEGKKYIPQITNKKYFQELLEVVADYVIERET